MLLMFGISLKQSACIRYYGLDPCHYFSSRGWSWLRMFEITGA